jgi:MFS superfamily sulfate permease-like transporter
MPVTLPAMNGRDLRASLSVAGLLLPEAVAYAAIAGLPPQSAILAAIAGSLVYAISGRSRFAVVAPTSSSAAILGASLAVLTPDAGQRLALAAVVTAMVGAFFLIAALFRLGGLAGFISRPVLRGFAFGLALTIILRQVPALIGLPVAAPDLWHLLAGLAAGLARAHLPSVATGIAALAALALLGRARALPAAFTVMAAGIAASLALDLPARGVAVVGDIAIGLPAFALPSSSWRQLIDLAYLALPLFMVLFAENWGTMRALALRHGDTVEPNRELAALGFSNLAAALVQGLPTGAGFSAGSASEAAGAKTRATAAIAAVGLLALMLLAAPLVGALPQPVVAAVVISALAHSLDPQPLLRLWRLKIDASVALAAAAGVLVLGIVNGMLFAIFLSLAALVRRMARPRLARLGRLDGGHDYVDIARHPEAEVPAGVEIWRPAEPLFFANAERILAMIAERLNDATVLVVNIERTYELDSTALDALIEFDTLMRSRGVTLRLARARDEIRDVLTAAGATDLVVRSSYSVDDAVASATQQGAAVHETGLM